MRGQYLAGNILRVPQDVVVFQAQQIGPQAHDDMKSGSWDSATGDLAGQGPALRWQDTPLGAEWLTPEAELCKITERSPQAQVVRGF